MSTHNEAALIKQMLQRITAIERQTGINTPTWQGGIILNGFTVGGLLVAQQVNVGAGGITSGKAATGPTELVRKGEADAQYVNVSGDTMAGGLVVPGVTVGATGITSGKAATAATELVRKGEADAEYVNVSGDTMTGNLTVPSVYTSNWFRSTGNSGWINETHGGGWFMNEGTWMRSLNNKNVYTAGEIRAGTKFSFGGTGHKFTHDGDTDTSLYYWGDGQIGFVANGDGALIASPVGITVEGQYGKEIRLHSLGSVYNYLRWQGTGNPGGGGITSNGPRLGGWSTVEFFVSQWNRAFLFGGGSAGHAWISGTWSTFSSIKNKRDVETINPAEAYEQMLALRPVTYYDKDTADDGNQRDGLIAEEAAPHIPNLVSTDDDGNPNGIGYGHLGVRLIAAFQHMAAENQTLRARVDDLETRLAAIEAALAD